MKLEALHQLACLQAADMFTKLGGVPTSIHAVDRQGRMHVLGIANYPDKRFVFRGLLAAYFVEHHITMYAHVSEAWMVHRSADQCAPNLTPSEEPDRQEAVCIGAINTTTVMTTCRMIRREGDQRLLSPPSADMPAVMRKDELTPQGMQVVLEGMNGLLELAEAFREAPLRRELAPLIVAQAMKRKMFDPALVMPPLSAYED